MIIYTTLGIIFGALIILVTRKISSKVPKYLAGIFLFFFFGVIASSIYKARDRVGC
jgi:glycopeptide antibiotics resistance protein